MLSSSRRSSSSSEIDIFIKDIKSVKIEERRNLELLFLGKWIDEDSETRYLVSGNWIKDYVEFLTGSKTEPVGPIDNKEFK